MEWDETRLRKDISCGKFILHFQPKIDLFTSRICGAEALTRYVNDSGQLVSASRFIGKLEERGLTGVLTRWVCREAVAFLDRVQADGEIPRFRLSFNVTAADLHDASFLELLTGTISGREYLALHMAIELTEESVLHVDGKVLRRLVQLRDMGFGISMDDFGTGFSSLDRLSTMPFTELKIDRRFVQRIGNSESAAKVIDAAVALAHYLNLTSVAEGIENQDQVDFLRNVGCEQGQGYLYAPAMDADTFIQCLGVHYDGDRLPVGIVSQAVLDHVRWHRNFVCNVQQLHESRKRNLRPRLFFPVSEFDPEECRLGRWLSEHQGLLVKANAYDMVAKPHADLHEFSERLWRHVVRGCSDGWLSDQLRALAEMSHFLVRTLYEVEHLALALQQPE